jgi:hypothetical protein
MYVYNPVVSEQYVVHNATGTGFVTGIGCRIAAAGGG